MTAVVVDMTGTDWKSALAALGERCEGEEAKNKSYVIRKKRRGVVFFLMLTQNFLYFNLFPVSFHLMLLSRAWLCLPYVPTLVIYVH